MIEFKTISDVIELFNKPGNVIRRDVRENSIEQIKCTLISKNKPLDEKNISEELGRLYAEKVSDVSFVHLFKCKECPKVHVRQVSAILIYLSDNELVRDGSINKIVVKDVTLGFVFAMPETAQSPTLVFETFPEMHIFTLKGTDDQIVNFIVKPEEAEQFKSILETKH